MASAALLLLIAGIAYYIYREAQRYYSLKAFGGHWTAGWTRLWLLRAHSSGRMNLFFTEANDKYGPTARIAPHMLVTCDPELYKKMNAVRGDWVRSEWYMALRLHPKRDNITSITDEGLHADLRKRMAPGYSGRDNTCIENDIDQKLLNLISLLKTSYISSESAYNPIDLSSVCTYFTLDVISQLTFGHAFGFLEANTDLFGYIANLRNVLPAILVFGAYTELTKILRLPFMQAVMPKSTDKRGMGKVMGFARDRVAERFGDKPVKRRDMLGSFIDRGLTQEELESETLTQITAGSDSTASALRMALFFISTNPLVRSRVLGEARTAMTNGKISRPLIKDSEARQLPYLQACIKETLRMYPPITGLLAKKVPPGGAIIDGKFAPAGTWIGQNAWGMQRNTDIYGVDVEVYRPERWLHADGLPAEKTRIDRMNDTVALVFGYGRFGCLGRGVATMELNKAVIEILLRFVLQPVNIAHPFDELVAGFYVHENMWFRVTERDDKDESNSGLSVAYFGEAGALPGAYENEG